MIVTGGSEHNRGRLYNSWTKHWNFTFHALGQDVLLYCILRSLLLPNKQKRKCTFDKHLCETLVFPNHALICSIVCQGCLIYGECSDIAARLHDIPEKDSVFSSKRKHLWKYFHYCIVSDPSALKCGFESILWQLQWYIFCLAKPTHILQFSARIQYFSHIGTFKETEIFVLLEFLDLGHKMSWQYDLL